MTLILINFNYISYRRSFLHLPDDELNLRNNDIQEPFVNVVQHVRHYLGKMDKECTFCKAYHFIDERLSNTSVNHPLFGKCCKQGQLSLPPLTPLPPELKVLYDGNDILSKSFQNHIREYNNTFAFTSLGVDMDDRDIVGHGPSSFTIHGELRHRTGSLQHNPEGHPVFSQLYIYDPSAAMAFRRLRNPDLNSDVLNIIQSVMLSHNRFAKDYCYAHEILERTSLAIGPDANVNILAYLHYTSDKDKRRYNLPSADEIAVIIPGDGSEPVAMRDIVLHLREGNGLRQISELHPAYLPLHYVLFFPHGELGWAPDVQRQTTGGGRMSQMDFYSYMFFERSGEYSPILRGKKLFQEFSCDGYASTEQNRLRYFRHNQKRIRSELFQDYKNGISEGLSPDQIGKLIVLPSSHIGSPRHMFEIYQDSMAITRYNKHPDVFLTMTANPKWPEVTEALLPNQNSSDRPDLVARIFELKRRALMSYIKSSGIFGCVVAHVYTIEFQKRGLPHMHLLIYLAHDDKIRTLAQVDRIVSAEIPDSEMDPLLHQTVLRCMIHGPCGRRNYKAPCMDQEKKVCTKHYPREWSDATSMDKDGYPLYCRRNTGKTYWIGGNPIDNRDVVPHNPDLCRMFDCHINVEVCAGIQSVKYIHKYIFKGHDRTTYVLTGFDEIQQYLDSRYIGSIEALWRIFSFRMHEEVPSVQRLALHLPGHHQVIFHSDETMDAVYARGEAQQSTLDAFFTYCASDPNARKYTYQEFPQHYVWHKIEKIWTPRKQGYAIGRMYFAGPNSGERFYLRLLLTVIKGPTSFEDLRTINGVLKNTFKEACIERGLLEDDGEWSQCLEEAVVMKTGYALRRLFCVILIECNPVHPHLLWDRFADHICDDLPHKLHTMFFILEPTSQEVRDYGLFLIDVMLFESGRRLKEFPPMPLPTTNWNIVTGNKLIWEQRQLQHTERTKVAHENRVQLNCEQCVAYNVIVESVANQDGKIFFLNGPAGTGKTFVYNTIAATCRSRGAIVIMVASSGIASLLLDGGRTAHSTFKLPLDILDNSVCGFTKQSDRGALFRETKLIIWDEVPMQHKFCVEAVDRTLQDIRGNDKFFGGITIVLGGDFRQCLPVIPKGVREQIVGASLKKSPLWSKVHILTLIQNMRLRDADPETLSFANTLIEVIIVSLICYFAIGSIILFLRVYFSYFSL